MMFKKYRISIFRLLYSYRIRKQLCGLPQVNNNLKERIDWAVNKPTKPVKLPGTSISEQRKQLQKAEKIWGNKMIGQTNNGQWTTKLGEQLVFDVLKLRGENPRRPKPKNGFKPDWETDQFIYEVKTSSWHVSGTAGEKVLGTWIKYQSIPELYEKPLKIVCIAYQEEELTTGKIAYFGSNITPKTKIILELAKSWNIEYVAFSDLVSTIL